MSASYARARGLNRTLLEQSYGYSDFQPGLTSGNRRAYLPTPSVVIRAFDGFVTAPYESTRLTCTALMMALVTGDSTIVAQLKASDGVTTEAGDNMVVSVSPTQLGSGPTPGLGNPLSTAIDRGYESRFAPGAYEPNLVTVIASVDHAFDPGDELEVWLEMQITGPAAGRFAIRPAYCRVDWETGD